MIQFSLFKVIKIVTPFRHRKPRFLAWLKVYVSYLEWILQELYQYWHVTRVEANMTPQIIFIERLLNDRYGRDPWDILIVEGYELGPWLFLNDEPAVPQIYVYNERTGVTDPFIWDITDPVEVDFVVKVPAELESEVPVIGATVQKYKLAGKRFVVQIY